jgi:HK97 family phage major capsid protein
LKNHQRALAFRAGNDLSDGDGRPVEQREQPTERDVAVKRVADTYTAVQKAAVEHSRGSFTWEMGWKTQGVTGLQGEAASGTSAPSALSGYFLGGTAGPAIEPEFIPGIAELRFYPNVIAGLFPAMPVSSPVVTYVRESSWTNNAAAVNEGATKPVSTSGLTRYTEQLGKIAHLSVVTDELIQDSAYFWALIQRRLADGVVRKEEVELLAGAGYPSVNGLLSRTTSFTKPATVTAVTNLVIPGSSVAGVGAGTTTVASVTPGRSIAGTGTTGTAPTGTQIAEGVLAAITDIRTLQFYEPDAVVMNPADYMTVRLAKDGQGQYLGGSFFGNSYGNALSAPISGAVAEGLALWSVKTVTTPALPQGYILVGAFNAAGQVLRKGGLQVDLTNSDANNFQQNLWTVRAEERVGLLIERPELFELAALKNAP